MVVTSACPAGNVVPSGNQCQFSCSQGYYLQGITTVTCHHNRTWSGKLPSCHLITCSSEDIPAPDHGRKVGCSDDREDYGTSCTLACEDGYEPTTPISKTCSDDGDGDDEGVWTGSDIACTIVTCPALTPPANGAISQCSFMGVVEPTTSPSQNYSAVCTVACNTGFTMTEGSAQRTCLSTGSWETSPTTCSDITPPVITCPLDVELIAEAGISSATVHWANLSQPQATDRGTVIGTHAYSIDSVQVAGNTSSLPASLSEGDHTVVHRAVDSAGNSATCSQNIWVRVVRCPPLQIPDDGAATLTAGQGSCEGGVVYGSTCMIACDSGFQMYPGSGPTMERICDWSMLSGTTAGLWTEFNPACYPVNCTVPSVTNGRSSDCPSATTEFRTSCQFSCSAGYTSPSGVVAVSRTCQSDQSWSGDDFQCTEPKTCPGNFSVSYGSVTPQECSGTDPVLFDTTCTFVCDDGFRLEGPGNIVCNTKGQWTHPSAPTCTDIQPPNFNSSCPSEIRIFAPMGTTSGIVNFQDPIASDNSGNVHVSKLNDHYRPGSLFPEGETVIGYLATDAAGMTTRCEIIITVEVHRCPIQQPLLHGSVVNCTDPLYGIRCSFSCDEGYDLIGPSAVSCDLSSDGSPAWEDAPPVCQIQTCPPLLPTNPATVVGCDPSSPVPYRSECTMQCPFGFVGVGEILKRCLADGVWSSTNFTCDRKTCSPLVETDVISITPSTCLSDPRYQDTCHLECQRSGFQIFPSEYEETTCTGIQIWSRDITVAKCKDTQPPTFVQCPSEVVVYASRSSDTALVSWNVTAIDNSDLEPTLSCDLQPGVMTRGIYQVSCSARDDAGNENDCIFGAEVKVRRCQRLVPPVHGTIEEACNDTFGGECTVSCSAGYKLIGSRRGSCEFNGTDTFWHFWPDPICEVMGCPPLPLNQSILVTPTDCAQANKVPLETVCVLHCDPGFTLEGDGQPLTCLTSEEWSRPLDVESLLCADRTPPTNLSCPLAPIMAVRKEYSGVEVTFDLPSADDAVDGTNLQVTTEPPDLRTPYTFLADTLCRFTFTDSSNNSASCLFHVFVSNEVQPIFEECPPIINVTTTSQITSIPWEKPSYLAIPGVELNMDCNMPNPARLPWGEYQLVCQVIDPQSGLHAECSRNFFVKPISCTPLRTPAHGSLVCDTFFYGKSCSIMCQEEHDIARSREFKGNSLYICGNSGRWSPSTYVPDCSEKKKAERFNLPLEIMYYADSCQSAESNTLPALKEKFIDIIKASLFQEICTGNQKCRAENVKVECGQGNSRRRRDAPELAAGTVLYDEKNKTTLTATISMVLQGPSSDTPLTDEGDSPHHHHKNLERLAHDIYHRIKGVVFTGDEETNSRPTPSLHLGSASAKCEVGFVADDTSHMCVACPAGHYFRGNPSQGECLLCERGTYQDRQAQTECKPCGDGRGTIEEGARSFSQCVALCQQGSYSSSGLEPCVRCERGTYQPRSGQSSCLPCPAGLTTPTHSSVSIQSCQEPCPAGHTSSTGFQPCFPCPLGFYQPHQGRTACHKCGDSTTTQDVGSTSIMMCH
ncbi:CUB and sushi domain-containing protein 3-like [Diadema antillarum]|uniref:CUB and sushi domain-containing protein 3-like n=1 Tax=Diadema antillarum TaxID=105358 RepID=UPI003A84E4EF